MVVLYIEAPFAAFRMFTAGSYRPTATFLTPSAAYGLLLNIAGIDSRLGESDAQFPRRHPYNSRCDSPPNSLLRSGLPAIQIAIGMPTGLLRRGKWEQSIDSEGFPRVHSMYQQLHNYPVGSTGKGRARTTKETKYNIAPIRREFVSEVRAVVAMRGNDDLAQQVRRGLAGELSKSRYGVPFLGDNAFLIDRLEILEEPGPILWYERVTRESATGIRDRTTRLTYLIDRADLSRTKSALYAPARAPTPSDQPPPEDAWTSIEPPEPSSTDTRPPRRSRKPDQ